MKIAQPKAGEPIRLVVTKTGRPRYRVVLDGEPFPDGKRRQVRSTFDTLTSAREFVASHKSDRARETLVTRNRQSFRSYAESWPAVRSRRIREVTARGYRAHLDHAFDVFGGNQLATVTRSDVEAVVSNLVAAGRSKRTTEQCLFRPPLCLRGRSAGRVDAAQSGQARAAGRAGR
jgi:hypothetical protein